MYTKFQGRVQLCISIILPTDYMQLIFYAILFVFFVYSSVNVEPGPSTDNDHDLMTQDPDLGRLEEMFPDKDLSTIVSALTTANGNVHVAVSILLQSDTALGTNIEHFFTSFK